MDLSNITEFLTYDNIGIMTQLIISGLFVMAATQALKSKVDRFIRFLTKNKVRKISTSDFTLLLSFIQVLFVTFSINNNPLDLKSIWLVFLNTVILYLGCTKGFDAIFKQISVKKEIKK